MPGWSDIYGLDEDAVEDAPGFAESAARIMMLVENELEQGVPPEKIAICGFSQGGALALYTSLRAERNIGACVSCR